MRVTVAKVHENLFAGEAVSLTVPTSDGIVTVLSRHEPLVAVVAPGSVIVRSSDGEKRFEVTDGLLEVSGNQATVLL